MCQIKNICLNGDKIYEAFTLCNNLTRLMWALCKSTVWARKNSAPVSFLHTSPYLFLINIWGAVAFQFTDIQNYSWLRKMLYFMEV